MMFSGLLVFLFVKLLYYTTYYFKKKKKMLAPIFAPIFFCVLPSLQFEKLKHYPILLMLDWFHAWLSG